MRNTLAMQLPLLSGLSARHTSDRMLAVRKSMQLCLSRCSSSQQRWTAALPSWTPKDSRSCWLTHVIVQHELGRVRHQRAGLGGHKLLLPHHGILHLPYTANRSGNSSHCATAASARHCINSELPPWHNQLRIEACQACLVRISPAAAASALPTPRVCGPLLHQSVNSSTTTQCCCCRRCSRLAPTYCASQDLVGLLLKGLGVPQEQVGIQGCVRGARQQQPATAVF